MRGLVAVECDRGWSGGEGCERLRERKRDSESSRARTHEHARACMRAHTHTHRKRERGVTALLLRALGRVIGAWGCEPSTIAEGI